MKNSLKYLLIYWAIKIIPFILGFSGALILGIKFGFFPCLGFFLLIYSNNLEHSPAIKSIKDKLKIQIQLLYEAEKNGNSN